MEATYAFDMAVQFAKSIGVDEPIDTLYNKILDQPYVNDFDPHQVAARTTMSLLVCSATGHDINEDVTDGKFVARHSRLPMKKHIYQKINASYVKGGPGPVVPLSLVASVLKDLLDEYEIVPWEWTIIASTGKFSLDGRFNEGIKDAMTEAKFEEEVIVPKDIQDLMETLTDCEDVGDALYYYGYPIWAEMEDDEYGYILVRTFSGNEEVVVEDCEIIAKKSEIDHIQRRYVKDLFSQGPIRSELLTFVTNNGEYWSAYPYKCDKTPAEDVEMTIIRPSNGFDLGLAREVIEKKKGWEIHKQYWGGLARTPVTDPLTKCIHTPRFSFVLLNKKNDYVDLLGHPNLWGSEYIKCSKSKPDMIRGSTTTVVSLVKKSTTATTTVASYVKWLKLCRVPKSVIDPFEGILKTKGVEATAWTAAWTLCSLQKMMDDVGKHKLSMCAGDFIVLASLFDHEQFEFNSLLVDF